MPFSGLITFPSWILILSSQNRVSTHSFILLNNRNTTFHLIIHQVENFTEGFWRSALHRALEKQMQVYTEFPACRSLPNMFFWGMYPSSGISLVSFMVPVKDHYAYERIQWGRRNLHTWDMLKHICSREYSKEKEYIWHGWASICGALLQQSRNIRYCI